jgi:hypothetical protein
MTATISPSAPALTNRATSTMWGWNRVHIASIKNSPFSRARATTWRASVAFMVNAFSTSTGFPASRASKALSRCAGCGVAT